MSEPNEKCPFRVNIECDEWVKVSREFHNNPGISQPAIDRQYKEQNEYCLRCLLGSIADSLQHTTTTTPANTGATLESRVERFLKKPIRGPQ